MKCFLVTNKTILAQEYTSRVSSPRFQMSLSFFFFLDVSSQGTPDHCGLIPCGPIHRTAAASWNKMGGKKNRSGMSVLSIFEYFTFDRKFVGPG